MNPHSGMDDNNKKNRTKAIAVAIPMAGIVVAAALLSGLSVIGLPSAMAQNMTAGGNATSTTGGSNATTTSPATTDTGEIAGGACAPAQAANMTGASAANMTGASAANMTGASAANMTGASAANMTANTTSTAGGNTTTSSPAQLIEQACVAAQNNDTQGVLMNLEMALSALSSSTTTTEGGDDSDEGGDTDDSGEEGED
ncbi:MAG: hypothetical protein ACJ701_09065 [Nitrososphaera sp.]